MAIAAAIKRAKEKKIAATATNSDSEMEIKAKQENKKTAVLEEPDNTEVIAQRKLRKETARLHKQQLAEQANSKQPDQAESNKAISDTELNSVSVSESNNSADDRKAKIAAVIAKAKAKKLAQKDQ